MMKFNFLSLFIFITYFHITSAITAGKSYLSLRPSFEAGTTERTSIDHFLQNLETDKKHFFEVVLFGGKATKTSNIASYFLPSGTSCVSIAEDASPQCQCRDINAAYLNIVSAPVYNKTSAEIQALIPTMTYASQLQLSPKRHEIGIGFIYQVHFTDHLWFDISTAFTQIKQNIQPCECIINNGGTGPNGFGYQNLSCSMTSTSISYGKILNCNLKKNGVPQVDLRFGGITSNEKNILNAFIGVDIPTGNKPCQRYMFEPVVGNNKHWGIFFSLGESFAISKTDSYKISLSGDLLFRYLFTNTQLRSFDLKDKPWSRYMGVWKNNNALGSPAIASNCNEAFDRAEHLINYSTLCAQISPKARFDGTFAINFDKNSWHTEIGYHVYANQAEEICIKSNIYNNLGIKALANYFILWGTNDTPVTRSFADIKSYTFGAYPPVVDYIYNDGTYTATYVPITTCDLDPNSAATPAQFIHTLYATIGRTWSLSDHDVPFSLNFGASYDISGNNNAPNQWRLWLQLGLAF